MNRTMQLIAAGVFLAWSLVIGETVTASSDAFTFPTISGVKNGLAPFHLMYFRCSGISPKSNVVAFAWSIPASIKSEHGTITVYSLLGKTIKQFHLNSRNGNIAWKSEPNKGAGAGIYFVRFAFGSFTQNSKLVINK
jgi:hypothetical protein